MTWFSVLTPRQKMQKEKGFSYGYVLPFQIVILFLSISYSIVSPIILLPGALYFGAFWLIYKSQLLFFYCQRGETFGKIWDIVFDR
jgi:hypothetical protein